MEIRSNGNPVLRRNQIHANKDAGVVVWDNGLGTLEDNDITGNGFWGLQIVSGNLTVRGNRINRSAREAVCVYLGGKGVIEDNDLTGNIRGAGRDAGPQSGVTRRPGSCYPAQCNTACAGA